MNPPLFKEDDLVEALVTSRPKEPSRLDGFEQGQQGVVQCNPIVREGKYLYSIHWRWTGNYTAFEDEIKKIDVYSDDEMCGLECM